MTDAKPAHDRWKRFAFGNGFGVATQKNTPFGSVDTKRVYCIDCKPNRECTVAHTPSRCPSSEGTPAVRVHTNLNETISKVTGMTQQQCGTPACFAITLKFAKPKARNLWFNCIHLLDRHHLFWNCVTVPSCSHLLSLAMSAGVCEGVSPRRMSIASSVASVSLSKWATGGYCQTSSPPVGRSIIMLPQDLPRTKG